MAGPMNVHEDDTYSYLRNETVFLRKAVELQIPVLGICLGAQLLARSLGASVTTMDSIEQGWSTVTLSDKGQKDPLFKGFPINPIVFQWHFDTFSLAKGAVSLASSEFCSNQAFRYKKTFGECSFTLKLITGQLRNGATTVKRVKRHEKR